MHLKQKSLGKSVVQQALVVAERHGEYVSGDRFAATFELQDGLVIEVEFAPDTVVLVRQGVSLLYYAHEPFSGPLKVLLFVDGPWVAVLEDAYGDTLSRKKPEGSL